MLTREQAESLKLSVPLTDGNLLKAESAFERIRSLTRKRKAFYSAFY